MKTKERKISAVKTWAIDFGDEGDVFVSGARFLVCGSRRGARRILKNRKSNHFNKTGRVIRVEVKEIRK